MRQPSAAPPTTLLQRYLCNTLMLRNIQFAIVSSLDILVALERQGRRWQSFMTVLFDPDPAGTEVLLLC